MTNRPSTHQYDIMTIGSGPAGWTAAVHATRANLSTSLLTGQLAGIFPAARSC